MKDIPTRFDHTKEPEIYQRWLKEDAFSPAKKGEPFSMVMPPPNVTGDLHLGHGLVYSIHDVMARRKRREGRSVLLLPGMDHAAIAVQALVEKKVQKEKGLSRTQLGREEFTKEVWKWIEHYMPRMRDSLSRLGLSADWSRFRFTMDEHSQRAVKTAFIELYEKGLIYRDNYLINWDPKLQTAVSDDEVLYKEVPGKLYWIKYGPITVATTRPETKLGDTAIAVNPNDARYKDFVGKQIKFVNELGNEQSLPVVADSIVDPEFGTGALKVTPAHDVVDWELKERHQLETKQVIDQYGKMTDLCGPYANLKALEAREKIVADLEKQNLIEKITDHAIRQPVSERSGAIIEPLPSAQWFFKVTEIKEEAVRAVKDKSVHFYPKNIEKVYFHWLENLHDWCISRQLWWGHPIPAYYCQNSSQNSQDSGEKSKNFVVAETKPEKCPICGKCEMVQDPDVLDTWFSSGTWPFSTLGWPDKTEDLETYFPTNFLMTAADILFFWVARMILMSQALTKKIPFETVYFHGLILDEDGQKMSKSRGNTLDLINLIDKHGADAIRMSLIGNNAAGANQRYSEQKLLKYRNFVTKIWNASRFVAIMCEGASAKQPDNPDPTERAFMKKLDTLEKNNSRYFERFQFNVALEDLYEFFWNDFASGFLEYEKSILRDTADAVRTKQSQSILLHCLARQVELISDFAPYVCDEIKREVLE